MGTVQGTVLVQGSWVLGLVGRSALLRSREGLDARVFLWTFLVGKYLNILPQNFCITQYKAIIKKHVTNKDIHFLNTYEAETYLLLKLSWGLVLLNPRRLADGLAYHPPGSLHW